MFNAIKLACLNLLIVLGFSLYAQRQTISGYVTDSSNGEALIGATVAVVGTHLATATNSYGYYNLVLTEKIVNLKFSYVGYKSQTYQIDLDNSTTHNVELEPVLELEEVVVTHSRIGKQLESSQMSTINLQLTLVSKIPSMVGEVDLIKAMQLYPGVSSGTEGSAGLYVRGGSPDQNLILLDGVPVYNVSHLFGFVSVFNPDAISNVQLYKGGFPARFGSRLSSVVDITMKEGSNSKFITQGAIGPLATRIAFEGPIVKDKTSFIVTARRSIFDLFLTPLSKSVSNHEGNDNTSEFGYSFYDLNAKVNHRFSQRSRIYFGVYMGEDVASSDINYKSSVVKSQSNNELGWGNITSAIRWNYVITPKLFSNLTLTYSQFSFEVVNSEDRIYTQTNRNDEISFRFVSGIQDYGVRYDLDYTPLPNHYVRIGIGGVSHLFRPGIEVFNRNDEIIKTDESFGMNDLRGNELFAYFEDDFGISNRFKINYGVHYSGFITKSKYYHSLQPRVSAKFLINEKNAIKAAFAKMNQYVHLVTKSGVGLPVDLWIPITDKLPPIVSEQTSIGVVSSLPYNFDLSVEGYYKHMRNVLEYKEGSTFFSSSVKDWEEELEKGKGWTYGIEALLERTTGKLSGWIAYTLAYNWRQFDGLNLGKPFFYSYDRRHDFNITVNYAISRRSDISAVWVLATGRAYTLADQLVLFVGENIYQWNGSLYYTLGPYASSVNNYRAPTYHRLDLSYNRKKTTKWGEQTWSFGVYNAYNRHNAFHLKMEVHDNKAKLAQYTLFPIIPFVNYSFKF